MAKKDVTPEAEALEGLSVAQYRDVLGTIALQAGELRDLLEAGRLEIDTEGGKTRAGHHFYVAQLLAAFIGSIADDATGGAIEGGPASWACMKNMNPTFSLDAGKGVQA